MQNHAIDISFKSIFDTSVQVKSGRKYGILKHSLKPDNCIYVLRSLGVGVNCRT